MSESEYLGVQSSGLFLKSILMTLSICSINSFNVDDFFIFGTVDRMVFQNNDFLCYNLYFASKTVFFKRKDS